MWPFGKSKPLRQIEEERFPELVALMARKWPQYLRELEKQGFGRPPLEIQLGTYGVRAAQALRKGQFSLRQSDDSYFMLAVATGIVQSGCYTKEDVERASGFSLPDMRI
jgi:hypothetical protein